MFKNINEDDGLQLIQRFNCEWKICSKVFLDYSTLTRQLRRGAHGLAEH